MSLNILRALSARLMEAEAPLFEGADSSTGIWYAVRLPKGWVLLPRREDELGYKDHSAWWESEVAEEVAEFWSHKLRKTKGSLLRELYLHSYGFPRGRITKNPGKAGYISLWGEDLRHTPISKTQIERAFSVVGECRWEKDEHEQCQVEDYEAVRTLLKIPEKWSAVDYSMA